MFPEEGVKIAAVALKAGSMKWERREPGDSQARSGRQDFETWKHSYRRVLLPGLTQKYGKYAKRKVGGCFPLRLEKDFLGLLWRVVWARRKLLKAGRNTERRKGEDLMWSGGGLSGHS